MKDKVAIVTGAASGIGRAAARLFSKNGAQVVIADRDLDGIEETLSMIKKSGGKGIAVETDISDSAEVKELVDQAVKTFGKLDYACNNAGIEGEQAFTPDCTPENWNRVIDINLRGTWYCMKHEIPEMLKNGGGSIVNISSIAGLIGFPGIPAYVGSKHGINGLTKTAALEYADRGIRVNSICPGAIETPMIDRFVGKQEKDREELVARHPMGRFGTPEEVGEAVIWLCSDKSSFITGQTLAVDGGYTAH